MTLGYPTRVMISESKDQRSKVKVTGSQSTKRRSSGLLELCTLSSAQPLVADSVRNREVLLGGSLIISRGEPATPS